MKRILALEGGGLRGVIEVAYLERLEALVRARRGPEAMLADVFDLVGGTSTGAIVATAIACGLSMGELKSFYFERGPRIFKRRLAIVAAGTGRRRRPISARMARRSLPIQLAGLALLGMVQDAEHQTLTMMQWMGKPLRRETINSELGDMDGECLTGEPLFSYLNLNFTLDFEGMRALGFEIAEDELQRLRAMDDLSALPRLYALGQAAAERQLDEAVLDALGL